MFAEPENPHSESIELIRRRRDDLEMVTKRLGLYLHDWEPLIAAEQVENGEVITHAMALKATFIVGDLALSKRVLDPDGDALDAEFEAMVTEHTHDRAIDITNGEGEELLRLLGEDW